MYYARILSTEEALFVSRAQQRIAALGAIMAEESLRNDVNEYNAQLVLELQYAVQAIKSTDLAWTTDEIQMVMDYYTIEGTLITLGFKEMIFNQVCALPNEVYATVLQLNSAVTILNAYDATLLAQINLEIVNRIAGDNALQLQIDNLNPDSTLAVAITAANSVGAIRTGDVFGVGTSLEDLWIAILGTKASVNTFTFNSFASFIEVGVDLNITQFTWNIVGTPTNLKISDDKGVMTDVDVAGSLHNIVVAYSGAVNEVITWTISGDNIDDVVITSNRVYKSFYGKETTANDNIVTVTEAKILAGTSSLQEAATQVIVLPNTANSEHGFIAVHKAQAGSAFTDWFVDNTNFSDIVAGEFIAPPVDVTVSGQVYSVYRWGYRSPLTRNLTLKR